jgi:hypothetical protein
MSIFRRVLLIVLVAALILAVVPLWGRGDFVPCVYHRPDIISYHWLGHSIFAPEGGFPHFPPHCRDFLPWTMNML